MMRSMGREGSVGRGRLHGGVGGGTCVRGAMCVSGGG